MEDTKTHKYFVLKIYNPIVAAVKTYKSSSKIVKIGSSEECDLQIFLPSLLPIHIVVDFEQQKITAVGNDVHCDTVPVLQGTSVSFSNDSVVRVHSIFMIFLVVESLQKVAAYDAKITSAASRFKEYSPVLKITHNADTLGNSIADECKKKEMKQQKENGQLLDSLYQKELGEFSKIPPIQSSAKHIERYQSEGKSADATARAMDKTTVEKMVIEKTAEEFKEAFDAQPSPEMLEAAIHKKLESLHQEANSVLDGDINIPINKPRHPDLGEIAIENDLLRQAESEIKSTELTREKVLEAEVNSLEKLKNNITDNIKEDIRDEISQILQDEAKDHVEKAVEECLQAPKFAEVISKSVNEAKDVSKGQAQKQKERKLGPDELEVVEQNSSGEFVTKRTKMAKEQMPENTLPFTNKTGKSLPLPEDRTGNKEPERTGREKLNKNGSKSSKKKPDEKDVQKESKRPVKKNKDEKGGDKNSRGSLMKADRQKEINEGKAKTEEKPGNQKKGARLNKKNRDSSQGTKKPSKEEKDTSMKPNRKKEPTEKKTEDDKKSTKASTRPIRRAAAASKKK